MLEQLPLRVMTATAILTLDDLGLGQECNLDQASRKLAERSEAQIVRWVQFPAGALFFTLVPDDPEWGGHSLAEYETLERTCRLTLLARQPRLLRPLCNLRKRAQGTGSPLHLRKF